jgi:hypothetical protein
MNRAKGPPGGSSTVRVVLGEAAHSRSLRDILDRAGFDVVGHASNPGDLLRLLAVIEPDVIVLDAEVSATAALSARDLSPLAGIVVVWPAAVSSSVADRQVTPARAALDLPDAVRRAVRPKEARVAALAPIPAAADSAKVIHLPTRERKPWRAREHAFGLVAASFIIAVAALGLLRTTVSQNPAFRGAGVDQPTPQPTVTPGGTGGENQQPQTPPNTDHRRQQAEPLGPVVLLAQVAEPSTPNVPDQTNEPPTPPNEGGDDNNGGGGGGGGGDGDGPGNGHGKGFNGYDNPRVHLVGSHRFDTSQNRGHQPCDPQPEHGRDCHAHPACT